jgi:hypothetical protein
MDAPVACFRHSPRRRERAFLALRLAARADRRREVEDRPRECTESRPRRAIPPCPRRWCSSGFSVRRFQAEYATYNASNLCVDRAFAASVGCRDHAGCIWPDPRELTKRRKIGHRGGVEVEHPHRECLELGRALVVQAQDRDVVCSATPRRHRPAHAQLATRRITLGRRRPTVEAW